jgi:tripartite-type tricarboxylate transporter receptor subunit TctC
MKMKLALSVVLAIGTLGSVSATLGADASAQSYPSRTVKIVVSYSPGGANDIVARAVAAELSQQLGQTFIVENRAGASGTIGADAVAKAAPDLDRLRSRIRHRGRARSAPGQALRQV